MLGSHVLASIKFSRFVNNHAQLLDGGALHCGDSSRIDQLLSCTFAENTAQASGGAISISDSSYVRILGSLFE